MSVVLYRKQNGGSWSLSWRNNGETFQKNRYAIICFNFCIAALYIPPFAPYFNKFYYITVFCVDEGKELNFISKLVWCRIRKPWMTLDHHLDQFRGEIESTFRSKHENIVFDELHRHGNWTFYISCNGFDTIFIIFRDRATSDLVYYV